MYGTAAAGRCITISMKQTVTGKWEAGQPAQESQAAGLETVSLSRARLTEPPTEQQAAVAIAAVRRGEGQCIHSGGESEIVRVGDLVVKRLYDPPQRKFGVTYAEQLEMIATRLSGNDFNVIVRPLACREDATGQNIVSAFQEGPNLSDLYHYAAYKASAAEGDIIQPLTLEVTAFLRANPSFSALDCVAQVNRLMEMMAALDPEYFDCTPRHSHFLVAGVKPNPDPYLYQVLELTLVDNK